MNSIPFPQKPSFIIMHPYKQSPEYLDDAKLMHLNFDSITLPAPLRKYCSFLRNLIFITSLHPSRCTPDILAKLPKFFNP